MRCRTSATDRPSTPTRPDAEAFLADALSATASDAQPTADAVRNKLDSQGLGGSTLSTGTGEVMHLDVFKK